FADAAVDLHPRQLRAVPAHQVHVPLPTPRHASRDAASVEHPDLVGPAHRQRPLLSRPWAPLIRDLTVRFGRDLIPIITVAPKNACVLAIHIAAAPARDSAAGTEHLNAFGFPLSSSGQPEVWTGRRDRRQVVHSCAVEWRARDLPIAAVPAQKHLVVGTGPPARAN